MEAMSRIPHVSVAILAIITLAGIAAAADPPVAVSPTGDADAEYVAVSGTGNASSCRLMATCPAVSGTGEAVGVTTASGTNNATSCTRYVYCVSATGTGTSSGYWAVGLTGDASGCTARWGGIPCVAVSAMGDATAERGIAMSGTGHASGEHAVRLCEAWQRTCGAEPWEKVPLP